MLCLSSHIPFSQQSFEVDSIILNKSWSGRRNIWAQGANFLAVGSIRELGMGCSAFESWSVTHLVSSDMSFLFNYQPGLQLPPWLITNCYNYFYLRAVLAPTEKLSSYHFSIIASIMRLKDLASLGLLFWKAKTMGRCFRLALIS